MNMKRKLTVMEHDPSKTYGLAGEMLFANAKTLKPDPWKLVSQPALAEKVEPGYLTKLATEIETINDIVMHSACGKLKIIEEQAMALRKQAMQILIETKLNSVLNTLPCNFSKKIGHVYSVYEKPDGEHYFSMISPEEWGSSCPHKYIGSFILDPSMSWMPLNETSRTSALNTFVHKVPETILESIEN